MEYLSYVPGCNRFPVSNERKFSIKTTKMLFFEKIKQTSISYNKENTIIQNSAVAHFFLF